MFELRNDREIPYFHRKLRNSLQNQQSYITFLLFYILNYNVSLEIYLPSYSRMKNKTKKKKRRKTSWISNYWKRRGKGEILKLKHRVESSLRLLHQRNFLDDAYRSLCTSIEISSTEEEPGAVGPTMRTAIPHSSEFTTRHYALSHRMNGWQITVDTRRNDLQPTHIYETWLKGTRPFSRQRERERERERREGKEPLRRSNAMLSLYLFLSLSLEGKKSFRERCVVPSKRRILEDIIRDV